MKKRFASLLQLELPFPTPRRLALVRALKKPSQALARLQKEQARLLLEVERCQAELVRAEALVRDVLGASRARIEPLYEEMQSLLGGLRQLMTELLFAPRVSKQKALAVRGLFLKVFGELPTEADLEPENPAEEQAAADFAEEPDDPDDDVAEPGPEENATPHVETAEEQAPAPAPPSAKVNDAAELRNVFRKLAAANHPDHTTDEHERQRRTRTMKELTLAYEAGDLAGLLRLEAQQQQGKAIDRERAEGELRGELRANVRHLKKQLAALRSRLSEVAEEQAELPSFRRSSTGEITVDDPVERELEREVTNLTRMRDFVQGFRDGRVTLKAFLAKVG